MSSIHSDFTVGFISWTYTILRTDWEHSCYFAPWWALENHDFTETQELMAKGVAILQDRATMPKTVPFGAAKRLGIVLPFSASVG